MADDTLTLDILTPTGRVQLSDDASSGEKDESRQVPGVEVPGFLGELGILPGHIPFITPVKPGVVRFRVGDRSIRLAVGAGFLEISEDGRVSILTQRAVLPGDVDVAAIRTKLVEVRDALEKLEDYALESPDHRKLLDDESWLSAQLHAAE